MRIFINSTDASGSRRTTRLTLSNCLSTTQLIREICREIGVGRSMAIVKLKY